MDSDGGKSNHSGVFVEFLRESWVFICVDKRSGDKVDRVECRYIITT